MNLGRLAKWHLPMWIWAAAMAMMLLGRTIRIEYDEGFASFAFYVIAGVLTVPFRFLVPVFGIEGLLAKAAMVLSGTGFYAFLDWLLVRFASRPGNEQTDGATPGPV